MSTKMENYAGGRTAVQEFPYFGKKETADVVTHISGSGINPFKRQRQLSI
jgi:hypothetical protein